MVEMYLETTNPIRLLPVTGRNQEKSEKDLKEENKMLKKMSMAALPVVLLAGLLPAASSDAAVVTKNLQAHYHDVKVKYNGSMVPPISSRLLSTEARTFRCA